MTERGSTEAVEQGGTAEHEERPRERDGGVWLMRPRRSTPTNRGRPASRRGGAVREQARRATTSTLTNGGHQHEI